MASENQKHIYTNNIFEILVEWSEYLQRALVILKRLKLLHYCVHSFLQIMFNAGMS